MRTLRRFSAALVLTLALTLSTYAGHIPCGVTDASPASTQQATTLGQIETGVAGDISTPVTGQMPTGVTAIDPATGILLNLLHSLLSLF